MTNLKIAILHNIIAPYRHPLFEELSKNLDLIVYQCSEKESLRKWDLWPRNYDYRFKVLPGISIKTSIGDFRLNPTIIKEIVKNRPHVIIISGYTDPTTWLALAMCKILKIPIIHWTEGIKEPSSFLGIITRPFRKLFITKSDAVIVPGKLSKKYVISLGGSEKNVFIAPNTIDNELFIKIAEKHRKNKNQLKDHLGLKDKIIIFSVGQLIERKGFKYLLQAYSQIEKEHGNTALIICGSGPLKKNLIELANMLNIKNFRIMESGLSLNHLIMLYSVADIFVLPTLEDVWGFVINEAMACGLPVISTYASQAAVEMIVNGENGFVVKEAHVKELYASLKTLVCNNNLRMRMSLKARETVVNKFSISRMVDGFLSAIKYSIGVYKK